MFYISRKQKDSYGVVDTDDGIEEFLTKQELLSAESVVGKIYGIERDKSGIHFLTLVSRIADLISKDKGTAVSVKLRDLPFKQTLYLGYKYDSEMDDLVFYFFDNSGANGYFGVSRSYILKGNQVVDFDFDNIDVSKVGLLLKIAHKNEYLKGVR